MAGELQRLCGATNGHRYFELVEKGEARRATRSSAARRRDLERRLPAHRQVLARRGQRLAEGVAIRCRVGGRLLPAVRPPPAPRPEIDPVFSLGELARRREQTLRALAAAGLLELNRRRPLAELPLSIALITSTGSAAYHDFLATLRESGYGFRVALIHSAVQGARRRAARCRRRWRSPPAAELSIASRWCAAAVSRSDLAAFDSRAIATAVARVRLPVLTGLGHEIDESVADRVAFQAFKTPTKVAEFLVARIEGAELAVARLREQMMRQARLAIAEAGGRLARAERRAVAARMRLAQISLRLAALAEGLRRVAMHRLRSADQQLASWARLVGELSPARTLRRGFSITRDATGAVLRDPAAVPAGTTIVSELAMGPLRSRVESGGSGLSGALSGREKR